MAARGKGGTDPQRRRGSLAPLSDSDDTIAAIITPPGEGGIAAVRIAGRRSRAILERHFRSSATKKKLPARPLLMRYGHFVAGPETLGKPTAVDEVMAVYMPEGKSYTGLEQVEIYCHGGRRVVREILDQILLSGARAAEPGEFTKLAFLSGRIDLAHAEAVAEIIAANTNTSYESARNHLVGQYSKLIEGLRGKLVAIIAEVEASIDFPEENLTPRESSRLAADTGEVISALEDLVAGYKGGRIIREGYRVAIAGRPNSGKSSLFNLLLKQERALVTSTAGTTRDYLSEWIELEGYAVNLVDTAGLRHWGGAIEKAGQQSAMKVIGDSDLVLWLVDLSRRTWKKTLKADMESLGKTRILLVVNKIDLVTNYATLMRSIVDFEPMVATSCLTAKGVRQLKEGIVSQITDKMPDLTSGVVVTAARHKQKLDLALRDLGAAREKMTQHASPELTAFDLRQAVNAIDEITGKVYTEEILERIFSKFCVGK